MRARARTLASGLLALAALLILPPLGEPADGLASRPGEETLDAFLERTGVASEHSYLAAPGYFEAQLDAGLQLPHFKVYDRSGRLIWEESGYGTGFRHRLAAAVAAPTPVGDDHLEQELTRIVDFQGRSITREELADPEFVFVEYWATWCVPCKAQMAAVEAFLAERPELDVRVLKVNWDQGEASGIAK